MQGFKFIFKRFNVQGNKILEADLECISITEILSAHICNLCNSQDLLDLSPPLQAFQAYAIHLYDLISDDHVYRRGEPTFLKLYGVDYVKKTEEIYKMMFMELAKDLERRGIRNAMALAQEQYTQTINIDQIRNSAVFPSKKAFRLQEEIAGIPASKMALLSRATPDIEKLIFHLANAMTTSDDLVDLFHGEDFSGTKTTIPISLLKEEFGQIAQDNRKLARSAAIRRTKDYIWSQSVSAIKILRQYNSAKGGFLSRLMCEIFSFIDKFPEEYL